MAGAGVAPAAKTMMRVLTEVAERYTEAPEEAIDRGDRAGLTPVS